MFWEPSEYNDKVVGYTFYKKPIEDIITVFVTNMVFQNVRLAWINKLKKTQV